MEQIILNILEALRRGETVDDKALVKLIHAEARREGADKRDLAKRRLLPFYQRVKREEPVRWAAWNVDSDLERQLLQVAAYEAAPHGLGRGDHYRHHQAAGRARAIACFAPTICACPKAICTPSRRAPVRSKIALTRICR